MHSSACVRERLPSQVDGKTQVSTAQCDRAAPISRKRERRIHSLVGGTVCARDGMGGCVRVRVGSRTAAAAAAAALLTPPPRPLLSPARPKPGCPWPTIPRPIIGPPCTTRPRQSSTSETPAVARLLV